MQPNLAQPAEEAPPAGPLQRVLLACAALLIVGVLVWQGVFAGGNPDPAAPGLSRGSMALGSGILVFREGLEAILVLAAVSGGMIRANRSYGRSIAAGAVAALAATVATWFIVVAIISNVNAPELAIQAGTGILAIVVLLVVMNWFFHKIYWTGWIGLHSKRGRQLVAESSTSSATFVGLALLGFTAIYREGFEIVLFLQDLRLKAGTGVVLGGAGIGLALTLVVAALTFTANRRLPYKRMLVLTGALLAVVLLVMVGESAQEMQQAGWLGVTALRLPIPDWAGVWFAVFPNVQGLAAQGLAAAAVAGSYAWIRLRVRRRVASTVDAGAPARAG